MNKKVRDLRLDSSLKNLNALYDKDLLDNELYFSLKNILELRKTNFKEFLNYLSDNIDNINTNDINDINDDGKNGKPKALIAFSGGIDSTSSAIISKRIFSKIGIKTIAITAYSPIIITPDDKKNILQLVEELNIPHRFIDVNLDEILRDTLNGKYHPCGRCHKVIENAILNYANENGVKYIIYGDMLSVGNLSIIPESRGILRINILSYLALTKNESREILRKNSIVISQRYGCPLLKKANKYDRNKKFTIQRILREVRANVIDKDEGLKNILEILEL